LPLTLRNEDGWRAEITLVAILVQGHACAGFVAIDQADIG
jgi:hypothetical protein